MGTEQKSIQLELKTDGASEGAFSATFATLNVIDLHGELEFDLKDGHGCFLSVRFGCNRNLLVHSGSETGVAGAVGFPAGLTARSGLVIGEDQLAAVRELNLVCGTPIVRMAARQLPRVMRLRINPLAIDDELGEFSHCGAPGSRP